MAKETKTNGWKSTAIGILGTFCVTATVGILAFAKNVPTQAGVEKMIDNQVGNHTAIVQLIRDVNVIDTKLAGIEADLRWVVQALKRDGG